MLYDVVRTSSELDVPVFIIGATVHDIIMKGVYDIKVPTATDDLDFGIAVGTWEEYEQLKRKLIHESHFHQDKEPQRLLRGGEKIDLVPYGGLETVKGEIAFPPSGDFKMSTAGFPEAFHDAISVPTDNLTVRMGSLRGIVLLKFIAYSDRPAERAKDVLDILFIAKNYLDAGADEKLYDTESDLLDDNFDYALAGARILGRDIAELMTPNTRKVIISVLERLCDHRDAAESEGALIREIKKGIEERT